MHVSSLPLGSRSDLRSGSGPPRPPSISRGLLADPSSLEPGISGIVGELANDHVAEIALEIVVFGRDWHGALGGDLAERGDFRRIAPAIVDTHLLDRLPRGVTSQVVVRGQHDGAVGSGEDSIGQIACVRNVVHAQVEPQYKVRLRQVFAVKEDFKIDRRVKYVLAVVRVRAAWLGIVLRRHHQVVSRPIGGVF